MERTHVSRSASGGKKQNQPFFKGVVSQNVIQRNVETCPRRPAAERADSQRPEGILTENIVETSTVLVIQDFAVNGTDIPRQVLNSMVWQKTMSDIAGNPRLFVALQGYTDCTGSDHENIRLREQRVDQITAAMPASVRRKIVFSFTSAETFRASNSTAEGRAQNRAVRILFSEMEDEGHACDDLTRAANFDELVFMVRCAENRLGLTSASDTPRFISVLRQIYYGNSSWSLSRNRVWHDVIPNRPWSAGDDPTVRLGAHLFAALQASNVVENTDIGHVLTGIDAMLNPQEVGLTFGRVTYVTGLANEEWATWAGDVGSAAAEWALESLYAGSEADLNELFRRFASDADLRGDIDSFSMRLGMTPGMDPDLVLGEQLRTSGRLSDILQNYYRISGTGLGRRRSSRIRDFITAYDGIIVGSTISNPQVVENRLKESIHEFASYYYMNELLRRGYFSAPTPPPRAPEYIQRGVDNMASIFVAWLQRNL